MEKVVQGLREKGVCGLEQLWRRYDVFCDSPLSQVKRCNRTHCIGFCNFFVMKRHLLKNGGERYSAIEFDDAFKV